MAKDKKNTKPEKTKEELQAEETLRKAREARKAEKTAAEDKAAEHAANAIPGTEAGELEYREASSLSMWDQNPRTTTAQDDSILADSITPEIDGARVVRWDSRYPAVIFSDGRMIQGNRRLAMVAAVDSNAQIPCIVYSGDEAGAMLLALNDTGTGIEEKGLGDVTRTVVNLMLALGLSAHTVVKYLWGRSREVLYRLSPAAKKADSIEKAQKASRGKLQGLEKYKRFPESIREQIYTELNEGTRKAKVFNAETVKSLMKAENPTAMDAVIEARQAELESGETAEQGPPNKLSAKDFGELKHVFKSQVFQQLAALFEKPGEGEEDRNAIAMAHELDATCKARE